MNRPYTPEGVGRKLPPVQDPQDKHFYSADGTPIRVCHPDGDVALVDEPRTLPAKFHRLAAKAGCLMRVVGKDETPAKAKANARKAQRAAVTTPPTPAEIAADPAQRDAAIAQAINDALDSEDGDPDFEDAWTADEKVNLQWLSERVGFGVDASERDAIQNRVMDEQEGDDDESDDSENNA